MIETNSAATCIACGRGGKFSLVLGKYFLIGLRPTADLHPEDRRLLSTLRPAGVILYRANFARRPALRGMARAARQVDRRGPRGNRPRARADRHRSRRRHGAATAESDHAVRLRAQVGRSRRRRRTCDGHRLASLGVNLNFAPVVDIDSNPANPVIGPRAFASDADGVIASAHAFIAGMQAEGVLACPKHFPGHGDTSVDSHLGLPVIEADRATLSARELRPFAAVAHDPVHLVMTAHILYPSIDPGVPATMSAPPGRGRAARRARLPRCRRDRRHRHARGFEDVR